jgi:protease-4
MKVSEEKQQNTTWERKLIENLAVDALKEKRRSRRWGIFFKLATLVYLVVLLWVLIPGENKLGQMELSGSHTALVKLDGVIADDEDGVAAEDVISGLESAFEDSNTQAVILQINSPGGSPVQSSYVQKAIKRLRAKHEDTPLYVVVSDVCASGGYYIASAADAIYVNESSIVGSIGVLMDGFGFTGLMEKIGIERRLLTAGEHKGILDPFSPLDGFDREHTDQVLETIHQAFIAAVREGRGDKLADDPKLFSGLYWSGERSIELGLADAIGDKDYVAREVVGVEDIVDFTPAEDPLDRFIRRLGIAMAKGFSMLPGKTGMPRFQ